MSYLKNPISMLQELMAKKHLPAPDYKMISKSDMPGPSRFECIVDCMGISASGLGANKKDAKQNCAINALTELGCSSFNGCSEKLLDGFVEPIQKSIYKRPLAPDPSFVNYVGKLNEYTAVNKYRGNVTYTFDVDMESGRYVSTCKLGHLEYFGMAIDKKSAKQQAARDMFEALCTEDHTLPIMQRLIRQPLDESQNARVIEKFKELTIEKDFTPTNPQVENISVPSIEIDEADGAETKTDLEKILKRMNLNYQLNTIKRAPDFIVLMTMSKTPITHLGSGKTEDEAVCDALRQALVCAKYGCDFSFDS